MDALDSPILRVDLRALLKELLGDPPPHLATKLFWLMPLLLEDPRDNARLLRLLVDLHVLRTSDAALAALYVDRILGIARVDQLWALAAEAAADARSIFTVGS